MLQIYTGIVYKFGINASYCILMTDSLHCILDVLTRGGSGVGEEALMNKILLESGTETVNQAKKEQDLMSCSSSVDNFSDTECNVSLEQTVVTGEDGLRYGEVIKTEGDQNDDIPTNTNQDKGNENVELKIASVEYNQSPNETSEDHHVMKEQQGLTHSSRKLMQNTRLAQSSMTRRSDRLKKNVVAREESIGTDNVVKIETDSEDDMSDWESDQKKAKQRKKKCARDKRKKKILIGENVCEESTETGDVKIKTGEEDGVSDWKTDQKKATQTRKAQARAKYKEKIRMRGNVCEICGRNFREPYYLQQHMRVHTGEKPYMCEICGAAFSLSTSLKRHRNKHSGIRIKCELCEKTFVTKSELRVHSHVHSKEKPYICEICGKGFAQRRYVKIHIKTHGSYRPYTCDQCEATFCRRLSLKVHKRIHSGEKPYQCSDCGREFTDRSSWNRHKLQHSGLKPFECNICGKTFTQSYTVKLHQRKEHGVQ